MTKYKREVVVYIYKRATSAAKFPVEEWGGGASKEHARAVKRGFPRESGDSCARRRRRGDETVCAKSEAAALVKGEKGWWGARRYRS